MWIIILFTTSYENIRIIDYGCYRKRPTNSYSRASQR